MRTDVLALLLCILLAGCAADTSDDAAAVSARPDSLAPADTHPASGAGAEQDLLLALRDLVGGPDGNSRRETWFSDTTAAAIRSVSVDSTGHAVVDFVDLTQLIPNASSSAGSALLLNELDSAVFSVANIESVEYQMLGSCARFWEWLQYSCRIVGRQDRP